MYLSVTEGTGRSAGRRIEQSRSQEGLRLASFLADFSFQNLSSSTHLGKSQMYHMTGVQGFETGGTGCDWSELRRRRRNGVEFAHLRLDEGNKRSFLCVASTPGVCSATLAAQRRNSRKRVRIHRTSAVVASFHQSDLNVCKLGYLSRRQLLVRLLAVSRRNSLRLGCTLGDLIRWYSTSSLAARGVDTRHPKERDGPSSLFRRISPVFFLYVCTNLTPTTCSSLVLTPNRSREKRFRSEVHHRPAHL